MLQRLGVGAGEKGPVGGGKGVIRGQGTPARRLCCPHLSAQAGSGQGCQKRQWQGWGEGGKLFSANQSGRPVVGEDGRAGDLKAGEEPRATCG